MTYATVTYDRSQATPELVAALSELARLAIAHTSKPNLEVLEEPPHEQGGTEQHPAHGGAKDS